MSNKHDIAIELISGTAGIVRYCDKSNLFKLTFPTLNKNKNSFQTNYFLGFSLTQGIDLNKGDECGKRIRLYEFEPIVMKKDMEDYLSGETMINFHSSSVLSMPTTGVEKTDKKNFFKLAYQQLPRICKDHDYDSFTNLIKKGEVNLSTNLIALYKKII